MDQFRVTDSGRPLPAGVDADTPLVALAWRSLSAEHRRRTDERQRHEHEAGHLRDALVLIAEQLHRLRNAAGSLPPELAGEVGAVAARLEEALARVEVDVFAPVGEPYTSELAELFENVAQRPDPSATAPRVVEVITPAVMRSGALVRMGKAVIGVPVGG
jgi:hypothetical protein